MSKVGRPPKHKTPEQIRESMESAIKKIAEDKRKHGSPEYIVIKVLSQEEMEQAKTSSFWNNGATS